MFAGYKTMTSAVLVHCLRQKTGYELLEMSQKMVGASVLVASQTPDTVNLAKFLTVDLSGEPRESHPFLPTVVDGVLLPKMPEEILAEKTFNTVLYIVEINKQEFGWFLPRMMGYPLSEGNLDGKTATSLLWKSYPMARVPQKGSSNSADGDEILGQLSLNGGEGLPHWPAYDQKEGYLQIGIITQAAQKLKD
ncbi:hypothetical protein HPG69_000298 [Diceros bicornis minor]|uniref:Carboxylesterase type B domain-containing protein n=1 Tax=Diceros bicornis minor TaxID=77932 RepID=A0A7J7EVJ9_DICBM|nr:hypothetical protein HPG69_000298 [Diceros bicornis minor]